MNDITLALETFRPLFIAIIVAINFTITVRR